MRILCYGDSNTYGFDPRDFFGGRYDAENRWCDLLARATGWDVINCGENGRTIPEAPWEYRELEQLLRQNTPADLLVMMLGTNDVLLHNQTNVQQISAKMDRVLMFVKTNFSDLKILLAAPPRICIPVPELCDAIEELSKEYYKLSKQRNIFYADAQSWPLALACDGVHLSEQGHHQFAEKMCNNLADLALYT